MGVYLDYNASAPIDNRVLEKMIDAYRNIPGNADSRTHDFGDNARKAVENARSQVASILNINKDEIFFTSGATESNNIVLQGLRDYAEKTGKKHIVTTAIEHKAVLETAKHLQTEGFEVDFVKPGQSGRVSYKEIINKIREDTLIVSVMHVNNETGVIQPVKEIGEYLNDKDVFFHIDATQSFGKLVDELREIKYDMLSMSAHKISGPQGVGALILRKKHYKLPPIKNILFGGQQERGIRPGTIPVALVVGLGEASEIAAKEHNSDKEHNKMIKDAILRTLEESKLKYGINGDQNYCVDSTISLYINGISSEALMLATKQYCGISNGSACNSNAYKNSYVLEAMDLPEEIIKSTIRISWGRFTVQEELLGSFVELLNVAQVLI